MGLQSSFKCCGWLNVSISETGISTRVRSWPKIGLHDLSVRAENMHFQHLMSLENQYTILHLLGHFQHSVSLENQHSVIHVWTLSTFNEPWKSVHSTSSVWVFEHSLNLGNQYMSVSLGSQYSSVCLDIFNMATEAISTHLLHNIASCIYNPSFILNKKSVTGLNKKKKKNLKYIFPFFSGQCFQQWTTA